MKLYYHPASPNGRRAILTLRHLQLEAEEVLIDVQRGDLTTPEYTALNPNQKLPTLVDADFVLWESNAIMQYLASKKPEAGLLPRDERGRADVMRWQSWTLAHFAQAVGTYNWENLLKTMFTGGEPDTAKLAQAAQDVERLAGILDGQLAERPYLCGEKLTIADLSVACALMYRVPAKVPLASFANIGRWIEGIEALDAWRSTQPKLG